MAEIRTMQEVPIGQSLVLCCPGQDRPPISRLVNGVGIVDLIGAMARRSDEWSWGTEEIASEIIRTAGEAEGLALYVASGGGEAGSYAPIADALAHAVGSGKPVEAWLINAASAAYGAVAVRGVRLIADPSALVAGLGTCVSVSDTETLYRGVGIAKYTAAIPSKAVWADNRVGPELFRQAELLRAGLDQQFRAHVALGRRFNDVQVEEAFAAGVVHASRALELGLVDEVRPITTPLNRERSKE